jgi:hypothetical protein
MNRIYTAFKHGFQVGELLIVNGRKMRIARIVDSNTFTLREPRWYDRLVML